ncbi:Uncharacterised protein [Amycolatopsis camponoti]|uniref:Uncharacterized protein n=1 Tax=Amycolatopsis camponoti TaxID=2606593 RepID=A0A6I8LH59_9PSEU|nr:Uncharacterised protein [Amycolatopsis camponoti]
MAVRAERERGGCDLEVVRGVPVRRSQDGTANGLRDVGIRRGVGSGPAGLAGRGKEGG